jgi:aspartyl-tRNA(Asn)/glutamyl-tRNA(Gln) amidotransferase subunit A
MKQQTHEMGVAALSRALAGKDISSTELTEHLLARVAEHQQVGAFVHVDAEGALAAA